MKNKDAAPRHEFGGGWTEEKLARIKKYLQAYTTIFAANPKARTFETIYVDAFAGTGQRSVKKEKIKPSSLFPEWEDPQTQAFLKGSARIALETTPSFKKFLFIEREIDYAAELEKLRVTFPEKASSIQIVNKEANIFLKQWCQETDWQTTRAVVLLDPYGMQVEWALIEALANTKAIDLWILFPLGMAVNRLLTKEHPPEDVWANALTRIFGTAAWKDAYYRKDAQLRFPGDELESMTKDADYETIGQFFINRLRTVFTQVAANPLTLRNSVNVPLYLLCFAAGNPRGAPIAVRIAQDILKP